MTIIVQPRSSLTACSDDIIRSLISDLSRVTKEFLHIPELAQELATRTAHAGRELLTRCECHCYDVMLCRECMEQTCDIHTAPGSLLEGERDRSYGDYTVAEHWKDVLCLRCAALNPES